ncbi:MAG TPA: TadE/TadG family type IV pilus assembly protein, partial [Pararhizobium sp.]|nr:TadE/TadG family type IV pilus assembly protein [Pararhizobium sp.]
MLKKIWKSRSGNFGILAAVLMVPLLLAGGMAVDYTNLSRLRSNLQNANDAAALMAAREFSRTDNLPTQQDIEKVLQGNMHLPAKVTDVQLEGDNLVLTSRSTANLFFSGILPAGTSQVDVLSAVKIQGKGEELDVVLVLDNTGSMNADGKIDALKDAASNFVQTLLALNTNGNTKVRIGIVPFSNYVNVGIEKRNASWIWVPPDMSGTTQTAAGSYQKCNAWTTDTNSCHTVTSYNDGVATGTHQSCSSTCTGGYTQVDYPAGTSSWSVTWRGCVGSRGPYPDNVKDVRNPPFIGLPSISGLSVPNIPSVSCPTPITPLTASEDLLKAHIQSMNATGNTYIAPGVMWGLRVLSADAPYTETAEDSAASAENMKHQEIMVLMTDGDNTKSPQVETLLNVPTEIDADINGTDTQQLPNPFNEGGDRDQADQMTREACQAVKDAKVTLYTISFGKDVSASGKALMR